MKKKVVRVIARLNIGGPAIHVILLSANLNRERYETLLVSGREAPEEGNMLPLAQAKNVTPIFIENLGRELKPFGDIKTLLRLYRLFRRERPDIVHTHTAKAGAVGRLAAVLAGVPVVIHTFHGHVLHGYFGLWKTAFFRILERLLARCCNRIIAVSEKCKEDLLRYKIGDPDKIMTIPLGLELHHFAEPIPGAREELRRQYNIPPDAFTVGMIARLVPIKRHEDLLRAIPIALQSHPDAYFLIVGDGELRGRLEAL
ncbi:MAG: glycosyltransferase, partial [Candidatus Hinthialibacter sp.]